MKIRTTKSTTQALERILAATGWKMKRKEKLFLIFTPGVKEAPIPKKSSRALALVVSGVRHLDEWEEIREAVSYDPGIDAVGRPDVPKSLAAWEQDELIRLAL
jgi:hypothetical protein